MYDTLRSGGRITGMRLAKTAHSSRPWRIHEIAPDFELEDVWALPTPGGADEFPRLVELATSLDVSRASSGAVRALFAVRWKLGELVGWDDSHAGVGSRVPTLRDRLPADMRDASSLPGFGPSRSRRCTYSTTSSRPRRRTRRCTGCCTSAGSRMGAVATAARWRSW